MKLTVASVLALISAAKAATDGPYSIGAAASGFEKGVLNSTLLCNVTSTGLNLKNQQIAFGVAAILPNRVHAGQPFKVIAGTRLIVPASINNLAYGFGARTYAGQATKVIVNAQGATPASIDAANPPLAIPSAPVVSGGVSVLEVPGNGGVVTVGPFQGASDNANVVFSFGDIAATIKTYNAAGNPTFLTANVVCPAASRPASLAYVAAGGAGSTDEVVPTGGGAITKIPLDSTAGVTGFTYACEFGDLGSGNVVLSVGGFRASNKAVASGSTFSISGGQGNVFLTQDLVDRLTAKYSNAAQFSLDISKLTFSATNASPPTLNGIPAGGISSPIQALAADAVVVLPNGAPATTLPDIAFTASGASGSTALLSIGDAAGTVHVYDGTGQALTEIAFSCPALSPAPPVFPFDLV